MIHVSGARRGIASSYQFIGLDQPALWCGRIEDYLAATGLKGPAHPGPEARRG